MEQDPTRNNGMSKPRLCLHIEQKHINFKWACVYLQQPTECVTKLQRISLTAGHEHVNFDRLTDAHRQASQALRILSWLYFIDRVLKMTSDASPNSGKNITSNIYKHVHDLRCPDEGGKERYFKYRTNSSGLLLAQMPLSVMT